MKNVLLILREIKTYSFINLKLCIIKKDVNRLDML